METEKIKIKQLMSYINKDLSSKVLFLGVSKKTKGGMTAVLVSYDKYIENMRFIPTWKLENKAVKSWYALQALVRTWFLLTFFHAEKVWSYSGYCLGWLHNNWIIDVNGYYVFFSEYAMGGVLKPVRHLKPLKSLRRLRPLKSLRHFAPLKPWVKSQWSSLTFEEFFGI